MIAAILAAALVAGSPQVCTADGANCRPAQAAPIVGCFLTGPDPCRIRAAPSDAPAYRFSNDVYECLYSGGGASISLSTRASTTTTFSDGARAVLIVGPDGIKVPDGVDVNEAAQAVFKLLGPMLGRTCPPD